MTAVEFGNVTGAGIAAAAPETVAALLEDRIARAGQAAGRLDEPDDPEGLHDFRVAIRRLRSLLRTYRDLTYEAVPRRLRRQLRRIARATNSSRDLQVKLGWLNQQTESLRPRERTGQRWLEERLAEDRDTADREALDLVRTELEGLAQALRHRLEELPETGKQAGLSFARLTALLILELTHELEQHLARVETIENQEEAHDARIAGKRVRYLLEPLVGVLPVAEELVMRLKTLQDLLGEMHDADVAALLIASAMEDAAAEGGHRVAARLRSAATLDSAALRKERRRDPMPGLIALAGRVQARRQAAWDELERDWLPHAGPRLLEPLRAVAEALERHDPGVEIERKYLLTGLPDRAREETPAEIDQGYLPGERIQERLRRITTRGGTRWFRTVKLGTGLTRQEFEEPTAENIFEALWPLTEGRRVRKRRYRVPDGTMVWEIDEFTDRDLVLAEVELPSEGVVPVPPDWLQPYIVSEVTEDPAYLNITLAH
ncbi:MAG TPA: CHAD domain-containing protein [Gemmatimonadales bacterium]